MYPIRWDWFHELRPSRSSRNGEPYIFEFRNVGMHSRFCGRGTIIAHVDILPEAEVIETTDPGPMPEAVSSNAKATGNLYVADQTTSRGDGDEDDGGADGSFESDSDEDDIDEDDSDEGSSDEDDIDEDMIDEVERYQGCYHPEYQRKNRLQKVSRNNRMARRGTEKMSLPRSTRPSVKRKRVVHSESRIPSTERPERPSTEQPGPAVLTNTNASNNTSADVGRTATPTSTHPPNTTPGHPTPPIPQNTPQPMLAGDSPLTPVSEAGTSGSLHETHRERALAKRQLELSKAMNRASELEARNRINEIKQEIESETKFGDVLGE
jgi:hypothetical protein